MIVIRIQIKNILVATINEDAVIGLKGDSVCSASFIKAIVLNIANKMMLMISLIRLPVVHGHNIV
jgi:hypothetical protein